MTTYTVQHGATGETLATGLSYLDAVNMATDSALTSEDDARALMARIERNSSAQHYHHVCPDSEAV
jgi:hypothetical protein